MNKFAAHQLLPRSRGRFGGAGEGALAAGTAPSGRFASTSPVNGGGSNKATPWAAWFRYGVGDLGLSPDEFWRLSLWEWLALVAPRASNAPSRSDLEQLMRAHPDRKA